MGAFAPFVRKAAMKSANAASLQPERLEEVTQREKLSQRFHPTSAPPSLLFLPIDVPVYAPRPFPLQTAQSSPAHGSATASKTKGFAKCDGGNQEAEEPAAAPATPSPAPAAAVPAAQQQMPQEKSESGQPGAISGTVPDVRTPPGEGRSTEPELAADASPKADAPGGADAGKKRFPVSASFHLRFHQPKMDLPSGGKMDPALSAVAMGAFSQPGGRAVSPFGAEFYEPAFTGIHFAFAGGKCTISGNLDTICPWGTNAGGRTDVPSATSPVVTAANWHTIHDDLQPSSTSPFKSPRNSFYSQALVDRHEKFHGTDDLGWTTSTGIGFVKTSIEAGSVPAPHGLSMIGTVLTVANLLDKARQKLIAENLRFYKGAGTSHDSFAGEIRAYADGRPEYQKLADAVEAQGKKLAAPPPSAHPPAPHATPHSPHP